MCGMISMPASSSRIHFHRLQDKRVHCRLHLERPIPTSIPIFRFLFSSLIIPNMPLCASQPTEVPSPNTPTVYHLPPTHNLSELSPKIIRSPYTTATEDLAILLLLAKCLFHLRLNDVLLTVRAACRGRGGLRVAGGEAVGCGWGGGGREGGSVLGGGLGDEGVGLGVGGGHVGSWRCVMSWKGVLVGESAAGRGCGRG